MSLSVPFEADASMTGTFPAKLLAPQLSDKRGLVHLSIVVTGALEARLLGRSG